MGTGSFPGVNNDLGVTLTPHSLLVPWSWKSRAIPLLPLWVIRPVQSLSACTKVHFIFFYLTVRISNPDGGEILSNLSRPALGTTQPPVQWVPGLSWGKERPGRDVDPSPLLVPSWKSIAIPLLLIWPVWPVQSLSACTRVTFTFFILFRKLSSLFLSSTYKLLNYVVFFSWQPLLYLKAKTIFHVLDNGTNCVHQRTF
jgi:hypothetical protein